MSVTDQLLRFSAVFLDFDGVIKDSVEVKSDAYERLFEAFGIDLAKRVRLHHEANAGMSRFKKLPLYLSWAGEKPEIQLISKFSQKFASLVIQRVIDSEWVPGARDFIQRRSQCQQLFVVTATPQDEIEVILNQLGIIDHFTAVVGAPTPKTEAIHDLLKHYSINAGRAVMVGDAESDYLSAKANQVKFVLRCTELNKDLQSKIGCLKINDFTQENIGVLKCRKWPMTKRIVS